MNTLSSLLNFIGGVIGANPNTLATTSKTLVGAINEVRTTASNAASDVSTMQGAVTTLQGNVTTLQGHDYITEQGTASGWTYRKWNSGTMEMWGCFSISGKIDSADAGGYATENTCTPANFPTAFISTPIVTCSIYSGSITLMPICSSAPTTSAVGAWRGWRGNSNNSSGDKYFNFICVGAWK